MKMEGDLERQRQEKKKMQIAAMKEKLEQRKKERMRKLNERQELERAQVRILYLNRTHSFPTAYLLNDFGMNL